MADCYDVCACPSPGRHVEIDGHEFPFSRGCSFYEVDDDGLITSARDLVESREWHQRSLMSNNLEVASED